MSEREYLIGEEVAVRADARPGREAADLDQPLGLAEPDRPRADTFPRG